MCGGGWCGCSAEYSEAYAYQQYRSLQQFFRWLAAEDGPADPMARLRPPKVSRQAGPVFQQRRTFEAGPAAGATRSRTGVTRRSSRCCWRPASGCPSWPGSVTTRYDPGRGDVDLEAREIRVRGKGGRDRTVRIGHEAARRVDRYLRVRVQARAGVPAGAVARGEQPGSADRDRDLPARGAARRGVRGEGVPAPVPASFQPHLAGARRRGGRPDGAERLGPPRRCWSRYGASARGARARRSYDRS